MQASDPKVGGSDYSPPCTRSQKDRFEKRLQNQEPLVERRRSNAIVHSEPGKGRPVLKRMETLPENKTDHAAAGKGQTTASKDFGAALCVRCQRGFCASNWSPSSEACQEQGLANLRVVF